MGVAGPTSGSSSGSLPPVVDSVSPTSELGETSTTVEEASPVQPYSIPVVGGWAYVCGTGHVHGSYGAAEQCGRAVVDTSVAFTYVGPDGAESCVTGTQPEYSPDGTYLYVHVVRDSGDPTLDGTHTGYPVANIRA